VISFGPEFAADLSAINAALPTAPPGAVGGAESFADADAELFNAMLGQMMGQGEALLDAAVEDGEASVEKDEDLTAVDPAALINPVMIEGVTPVAVAPVATFVWTIPAVATTPATTISIDVPPGSAGVAPPGSPGVAPADTPAALPPASDLPEAIDLPLSAEAPVAPSEKETPSAPGPRLQAGESRADTTPPPSAAAPAPIERAAEQATPSQQQPRSEFAQQITDAISKNDRPSRSAKSEKAPVEPKIEADGIRPVPFTAVERAYAGNGQDASRSFDAPKEQAQPAAAASPSNTAASAPMPAFVVPVEGRSMLNAPAVTTLDTVDVPAAMARDIDTHVPAQIVQSIRLQAINGGGEAIIRLNPDYLGEVVVAVKVEQGSVIAALQAETPAVRQWAERNESVLRQALAEQGLQLDRLTVADKGSETETEREGGHESREDAREKDSQQQPRRRRPQSDEATFEVTV